MHVSERDYKIDSSK